MVTTQTEVDGHFILFSTIAYPRMFGVAHKPDEADQRLYEEARDYALDLVDGPHSRTDDAGYTFVYTLEDRTNHARESKRAS